MGTLVALAATAATAAPAATGATAAATGATAAAAAGGGISLGAGLAIDAALIGQGVSGVQGRKAAKSQERAQRIQQKQQAMQTARERRKQIRAARSSQADLRATAFAQGTAQTSRTSSISGNITAEKAGNLNFIDQTSAFTSATGQQNIKATQASSKAGTYSALAGLAMQGAEFGQKAKGTGLFD